MDEELNEDREKDLGPIFTYRFKFYRKCLKARNADEKCQVLLGKL